jgi:hypothetical protein
MKKTKPRKRKRFDFDTILLLLMLMVGCTSALVGFSFGRSAIKQVNPNPTDRRVLRPNQLNKPRKVNRKPVVKCDKIALLLVERA